METETCHRPHQHAIRSPELRIAFITHYTELYGANLSLLNLIDGLSRHGIAPHVVCPEDGDLPQSPQCSPHPNRGCSLRVVGFPTPHRWAETVVPEREAAPALRDATGELGNRLGLLQLVGLRGWGTGRGRIGSPTRLARPRVRASRLRPLARLGVAAVPTGISHRRRDDLRLACGTPGQRSWARTHPSIRMSSTTGSRGKRTSTAASRPPEASPRPASTVHLCPCRTIPREQRASGSDPRLCGVSNTALRRAFAPGGRCRWYGGSKLLRWLPRTGRGTGHSRPRRVLGVCAGPRTCIPGCGCGADVFAE